MKVVSLILLTFLLVNFSEAQNFDAHIIGGFNISQIDGDKLSGYNKMGLVLGGATSFKLNKDWHFNQEIVYYQRGSRATEKQLTLDNFEIRRIDYIDFSLSAQRIIKQKWSALAGLGYGAFIKVKSDIVENKSSYTGDLFGVLGFQYQLSEAFSLALKGQYSIQPIYKNQDAYNNALSLVLYYKII